MSPTLEIQEENAFETLDCVCAWVPPTIIIWRPFATVVARPVSDQWW